MRLLFLVALMAFMNIPSSRAQFSAQNDAMYIATLKAVVNYKIDDAENLANVESLRENQLFNQRLARMLDKLQNTLTKDTANRRVTNILIRAGNKIYDELK